MSLVSSFTDFFQYDFLLYALVGTILLSITMGILSPLIVVKKYSFIGSAISHSTLLGLSIAMLFELDSSSFAFFAITTLVTLFFSLILAKASFNKTLPADSLIGIFYTATMSSGIMIQNFSKNQTGDLFNYLFGNILLVDTNDIYLLLALTIIVTVYFKVNFKKWISFCWNDEMAKLNGIPHKFYHYLFFLVITLSIVLGLKVAGIILVSSFLIIPGAFALKVSSNINQVFTYSVIFAILTSVSALFLSNAFNITVGPTIAVVQATVFAFTYIKKIR